MGCCRMPSRVPAASSIECPDCTMRECAALARSRTQCPAAGDKSVYCRQREERGRWRHEGRRKERRGWATGGIGRPGTRRTGRRTLGRNELDAFDGGGFAQRVVEARQGETGAHGKIEVGGVVGSDLMARGQIIKAGQVGERRRGVNLKRKRLQQFKKFFGAVGGQTFAPHRLPQRVNNFQRPDGWHMEVAA